MATKRRREGRNSWEYIIKRKELFAKPISLTFDDEKEGDEYVRRLEALLDRGIVPERFADRAAAKSEARTIGELIREYLLRVTVRESDEALLNVLFGRIGDKPLMEVSYTWAENWIAGMKRELALAPVTIRHYVGALARCFDWGVKQNLPGLPANPLRHLPERYAVYNKTEAQSLRARGQTVPSDQERDRRLLPEEEARAREILAGQKPDGRERAFALHYQAALECLFDLALESAMRLREMYTLELDQVDVKVRTIFLDRTKNGSKRQVPLTSVAILALERYFSHVREQTRGMAEFDFDKERRLFPFWDGREPLKKVTARLSRQFARIFEAASVPDCGFHDLRHEATSRLYERTTLSDVQIAKITGHKDLRVLARYANLRASDLAPALW